MADGKNNDEGRGSDAKETSMSLADAEKYALFPDPERAKTEAEGEIKGARGLFQMDEEDPFAPGKREAEIEALLEGNSSPVDPFTGTQVNFRPFLLDGGHFTSSIVINPPPMLPGTDPAKRLHLARGTTDGPLYVSDKILVTDPPWLRLAYMPYPVTNDSLSAFLTSVMPRGIKRFEANRTRPTRDQIGWLYELQALDVLEGSSVFGKDAFVLSVFRRGWIEGKTLREVWSAYQHLTISVLWAWGVIHERIQFLYCQEVGEEVGRIYQNTQSLSPLITQVPGFEPHDSRAVLEVDRARYTATNAFRWQAAVSPASLGRLVEGLYMVIGTAGTNLGRCPNCARLYWKPDGRKLFCGPPCRTTYNRKQSREGNPGGKREQERRRQAEAQRIHDEAKEFDMSVWTSYRESH